MIFLVLTAYYIVGWLCWLFVLWTVDPTITRKDLTVGVVGAWIAPFLLPLGIIELVCGTTDMDKPVFTLPKRHS